MTKDDRHLDLAQYFVDARGQPPNFFAMEALERGDEDDELVGRTYTFNQSHRPVRNEDTAIGHVVRALTMYAAMACLAGERRDGSLQRAVEALWADVTLNQMYVTGGVGQNGDGTFGAARDCPTRRRHAETSAAVALVHWAKRMLTLELDGKYADVLELALYNGALGGLSRDGEHYFDTNPLADNGAHRRWAWNNDPRAATNIARLVASVGGLFYSVAEDGIAIHLYGGASATVNVGGRAVSIKETSTYPWSGKISVVLDPVEAGEFTLRLRIPAFAREAKARINGAGIDVAGNVTARLSPNPADLEPRRHGRSRPADAGGAHPCASGRRRRPRAGGAAARAAGLLLRGGGQPASAADPHPPAQGGGAEGADPGRSFRRYRHDRGGRRGDRRPRRGRASSIGANCRPGKPSRGRRCPTICGRTAIRARCASGSPRIDRAPLRR